MRILGIDPGIATTGFAVLETDGIKSRALIYGCIRTSAGQPMPDRLHTLYSRLQEILSSYQPDNVAIEKLFFAKNANSAMQVGEARGVAVLAACHAGLAVFEYTPLQVKQAVVGYGKAEKGQVQQMVKLLLALEEIPRPDDAADALAIAICHAHTVAALQAAGRREKRV
ncbi:MAG: crossover junction endodeoxyribonuclease RuvC [Firmicutes bacterium]|jgi:crossover junction endodeoxyribonuclease RuvC|nr:crossover junction endodeoxyribonuclease RuvC [Bacillota bacterium]